MKSGGRRDGLAIGEGRRARRDGEPSWLQVRRGLFGVSFFLWSGFGVRGWGGVGRRRGMGLRCWMGLRCRVGLRCRTLRRLGRTCGRGVLLDLGTRCLLRCWMGLGYCALLLRCGSCGLRWASGLRGGTLLDLGSWAGRLSWASLLWLRTRLLDWLRVLLIGGGAVLFWTWLLSRGCVTLRLIGNCTAQLKCRSVGVLGFYSALLDGALLLLTNCGRRCSDVKRCNGTSCGDFSWLAVVG
jgi:hypothetical protein